MTTMTAATAAAPGGMADYQVAAALTRAFQTGALRPEGCARSAELIRAAGLDGRIRARELSRTLFLNWGIAPGPERDDFDLKDLYRVLCAPLQSVGNNSAGGGAEPAPASGYEVAAALKDAFRKRKLQPEGRAGVSELIRVAALDGRVDVENLVLMLGSDWEITGNYPTRISSFGQRGRRSYHDRWIGNTRVEDSVFDLKSLWCFLCAALCGYDSYICEDVDVACARDAA